MPPITICTPQKTTEIVCESVIGSEIGCGKLRSDSGTLRSDARMSMMLRSDTGIQMMLRSDIRIPR